MTEIYTQRLHLTQIGMDDLEDLARVFGKPENMRFFSDGTPKTQQETRDHYIKKFIFVWTCFKYGMWAVRLKQGDTFLGMAGLDRELMPPYTLQESFFRPDVEMRLMIDCTHWKKGYGREAAVAVLEDGFKRLSKETEIKALIYQENGGADALFQDLGFQLKGEHHEWGGVFNKYGLTETQFATRLPDLRQKIATSVERDH